MTPVRDRRRSTNTERSRMWDSVIAAADDRTATETMMPVELSADHVEAIEVGFAKPTGRGSRTPLPVSEMVIDTSTFTEFNRRYRVHERLDGGGMATVVLARQHALARDVAVKVQRKDDSPTRRLLFRAEALVTAYLEHPNIVPVYDAADNCLVMRRVRGSSLAALINERTSDKELPRLIEAIVRACDAIAFAHSRGIMHRDIKAENVMVGEFGEVLVVDWGLALSFAPGPDGEWHAPRLDHCPSVCAGTPGCVPPEIARGEREEVGAHTDLHMLGGMLYHVLAGHMPFDHQDRMEALLLAAGNLYPPLAKEAPSAPARLVRASERAMAFLPEERGTIAEFVTDLRTWLGREVARDHDASGRRSRAMPPAPIQIGFKRRLLRAFGIGS
ncbi:MAG: serine/threonine-protein kinase [Planctomycetota bacterium]